MQPLIRKECSSSAVRKVCRGNCVSTIIITLLQNYFFLKIGSARSRGTSSEVLSVQSKELSAFSLTCLQISIACPLVRDVGYHCSFFSYEKTVHPLNKFLGELLQSTIYTVLLIWLRYKHRLKIYIYGKSPFPVLPQMNTHCLLNLQQQSRWDFNLENTVSYIWRNDYNVMFRYKYSFRKFPK